MKYSIIIILLSFALYSCEKTPNELIIGTWVGVAQPEIDTVIFTKNTVLFKGRALIEEKQSYSIDENNIYVTYLNGNEYVFPYEFTSKDKIYIKKILITQGLGDDGGLEFSK